MENQNPRQDIMWFDFLVSQLRRRLLEKSVGQVRAEFVKELQELHREPQKFMMALEEACRLEASSSIQVKCV